MTATAWSSVLDALQARARDQPAGLAFDVLGERISWGELLDTVGRIAAALATAGLRRGDRCGIALPTSLDVVACFFGVQWLGAAPVPLNPEAPADQVLRRLRTAGCRAAVVDPQLATALRFHSKDRATALPLLTVEDLRRVSAQASPKPSAGPDDVAYLQFTSGTAGDPRAAVILHRQLAATLAAMHGLLQFGRRDVMAGALPLHHSFGLVRFVCAPVFSGCASHIVPAGLAGTARWIETMSRVGATITAGPDSLYRSAALRIDASASDLHRLRFASCGGEAVRLDTIRLFEERFRVPGVVRPGYGLTETTLTVTSLAPGLPLRTDATGTVTCGPPVPGVRLRIVDDEGVEVATGVRGEIQVSGPSVFAGYYGDAAGTAAVLGDGWLRTGDEGSVDADGYLYVTGRARSMIKRGGAALAPREIEEAVERTPGIARSAAVGIRRGAGENEQIVVVAEVDEPAGDRDLPALARRLAAAVVEAVGTPPGEILFVKPGALPVTASGKVRHGELRRQVEEGTLRSTWGRG